MGLGARSIASLAAGFFNMRGDSSKFIVVFDNATYDLGAWSKVSGLNVSWDPLEYRTGGTNNIWVGPGRTKYSKITLTRATCPDSATVQEWLAETAKDPKPFSGSIKLLSWLGIPLVEWTLKSFYPTGWKINDFESKAATVVLETLEIVHTGFLEEDYKLDAQAPPIRPSSPAPSLP
jgi:phage tail-like protein